MPQRDFLPICTGRYWIAASDHIGSNTETVIRVVMNRRNQLEADTPPGFARSLDRYQWLCGAISPSDMSVIEEICSTAARNLDPHCATLTAGRALEGSDALEALSRAYRALRIVADCCSGNMCKLSGQSDNVD